MIQKKYIVTGIDNDESYLQERNGDSYLTGDVRKFNGGHLWSILVF
jgi:hypothetical protein